MGSQGRRLSQVMANGQPTAADGGLSLKRARWTTEWLRAKPHESVKWILGRSEYVSSWFRGVPMWFQLTNRLLRSSSGLVLNAVLKLKHA